MKKYGIIGVTLTALTVIILSGIAGAGSGHSNLTYNGPATCLTCHEVEATQMHASNHYQWQGQSPYMISGPPVQGKLISGVNSY